MKKIALILGSCAFSFVLLIVFAHLFYCPTDIEVDSQTQRECLLYSLNHPERSVPTERMDWAKENDLPWAYHYDYFEDCMNQKRTVVALQ